MDEKFCPGCGNDFLRKAPFGEGYESPCTLWEGKTKEQLLVWFKDQLSKEEMTLMLEHYGFGRDD